MTLNDLEGHSSIADRRADDRARSHKRHIVETGINGPCSRQDDLYPQLMWTGAMNQDRQLVSCTEPPTLIRAIRSHSLGVATVH